MGITEQLSEHQKVEIMDMFARLDPHEDGWVSADKIISALSSVHSEPMPSEAAVSAVIKHMTKGARHAHHRATAVDFLEWMAHDMVEHSRGQGFAELSRSMHGGLILSETGSRLWDLLVVFRRKQMLRDVQQGGKARLALSDLSFVKAHPEHSGLTTPQLSLIPSSPGMSHSRAALRSKRSMGKAADAHGSVSMSVPHSSPHSPSHKDDYSHHQGLGSPKASLLKNSLHNAHSSSQQPVMHHQGKDLHGPQLSKEHACTSRLALGVCGAPESPPIGHGVPSHHGHHTHHEGISDLLLLSLDSPAGSRTNSMTGMSRLGLSAIEAAGQGAGSRHHDEPAWHTPQRLSFGGAASNHDIHARMLWHGMGSHLLPDPMDDLPNRHQPVDAFRAPKLSHLAPTPEKEWLPEAVSQPPFMKVELPRDPQCQLDLQLIPTSPVSVLSEGCVSPAVPQSPSRAGHAAARPRSAMPSTTAHSLACPAVCDAVTRGEAPLAQAAMLQASQADRAASAEDQKLKTLMISSYFKQMSGLSGSSNRWSRSARASCSTLSNTPSGCSCQERLRGACTPSPTTQKLLLALPRALRSPATTTDVPEAQTRSQTSTPTSIPDPRLNSPQSLTPPTKPATMDTSRHLSAPGSRARHRPATGSHHVITLDVVGMDAHDPLVQGLPPWLRQEVSNNTLARKQQQQKVAEASVLLLVPEPFPDVKQQDDFGFVIGSPQGLSLQSATVPPAQASQALDEFDLEVAAAMGLATTTSALDCAVQEPPSPCSVRSVQQPATQQSSQALVPQASSALTSKAAMTPGPQRSYTEWTSHYVFPRRPKTSHSCSSPGIETSRSLQCSSKTAARFVLSGAGAEARTERARGVVSAAPRVAVRLNNCTMKRMQHVLGHKSEAPFSLYPDAQLLSQQTLAAHGATIAFST